MHPDQLTEREKNILRYIVQQFILTAAPVGSRLISKRYELGLSPATIRNIMSDLEDSGYIGHPHTSAGRFPTDKGYRFYVDWLMNIEQLSDQERERIHNSLVGEINDKDEIFKNATKLLGAITKQLAYVSYPKLDTATLEKIQIVYLSSTRVLIVISINSGIIKTITLELDSDIKEDQIIDIQNVLNERLSGLTFRDIKSSFKDRFKDVNDNNNPIINLFVESLDKIFKDDKKDESILISGAKDVIKHPEFEDPERFKGIIELIEDKDIIVHILEKSEIQNNSIFISIGQENENLKLNEYSFISKEYKMGDNLGTLGIIGPKRMEYPRIVAIVDYISKMLSEILK